MERLLRPVTSSTSSRPAATASSTTYWMAGLSTTGSISLGVALVAGRNLVPRPAAGITALVTSAMSRTLANPRHGPSHVLVPLASGALLRLCLPARLRALLTLCLPARLRALLTHCLPSSLLRRSSVQAVPRPLARGGVQAAARPFGSGVR